MAMKKKNNRIYKIEVDVDGKRYEFGRSSPRMKRNGDVRVFQKGDLKLYLFMTSGVVLNVVCVEN